ncbi:MAG: hypothetical protein ACHQAX_09785 [Gammaproteobacteria bacterium]
MIRKLLCGALSAILLGQASVVLADNLKHQSGICGTDEPEACMHASELVNFTGYKTIHAEVSLFDDSGNLLRKYSGTSCVNSYGLYFQEGSIKPGLLSVSLFIQNSGGWLEYIDGYDVVFTGKPKKALQANPKLVRIGMSSYSDAEYPACEPTTPFVLKD